VFVSSTLQELAEERAAARQAVASLRLAPVMFDLGARPHPPRDLYRAYLDQSHIFIGIYWQRYGWVAPGENISGLEDEYRLSGDKPKLIYVKSPAQEREPRLKELLTRIQQDDRASYKYFTTAIELRELIENDLAVLLTERFETAGIRRESSAETPGRRHNLPAWPTPFVGREKEITRVRDILRREDSRLVTLTGPGGVGKTRLGLRVAADLLGDFEDGVFFIPFETSRDRTLVISTIADTLGVREISGRPLLETLKDYLRSKHMLLALDGFERAISAAPLVAEILMDCPKLKVLVTSRAPLHLRGEREFPVLPLALPDSRQPLPIEELSRYEAIMLFVQRAVDVKPDFALTDENAQTVAEICERLDGLPLAIELAAARIKMLPPQALLTRLSSRLELLTGGARDLPPRQQTLRNAIDWSYDLLDKSEKVLFRRMAVFAGGCTFDAAEPVCNAAGDLECDILEGMTSLVDESLLRQGEGVSGEPRFWMLQTIREYGLDRLAESGEAAAVQRRHADFFLALAEQVESKLRSGERDTGLQQAEAEHDNLRAALVWNQTADEGETGLRLAGALWWFWYLGGHWSEGRGWLEGALTRTGAGSPVAVRAKALLGVGVLAAAQGDGAVALPKLQESNAQFRDVDDQHGLAYALAFLGTVMRWHGDPTAGRSILEESVALFRRMGEKWGLALALGLLGDALIVLGREEEAQSQSEESVALFRELGDKWGLALALTSLGDIALQRSDDAAARSWLEESVAILREVRDKSYIGLPLLRLGDVARHQGGYERAAELYEEGLALYREGGSKWGIALSLHNLGRIAIAQGDYRRAAVLFEESLPLYREAGNTPGVVGCLVGLAGIAAAQGQPERAVRLFSAAQGMRDSTNAFIEPADRLAVERDVAAVRAQLSEEAFAAAWAQGRAMTLEQAIADAQGISDDRSKSVRNTAG
jgi:predicted ATPase